VNQISPTHVNRQIQAYKIPSKKFPAFLEPPHIFFCSPEQKNPFTDMSDTSPSWVDRKGPGYKLDLKGICWLYIKVTLDRFVILESTTGDSI